MTLLRIRGQCFEAESQVREHGQESFVIELELILFAARHGCPYPCNVALHEFMTIYPLHNFVFPSRTPISDELNSRKGLLLEWILGKLGWFSTIPHKWHLNFMLEKVLAHVPRARASQKFLNTLFYSL